MPNSDLLERIDERLRAMNLTDYRASILAAGRPEIIRNIRRGRSRNPRRDTLEKLARVLGCSFEWLATGRGPVEPPAEAPETPGAAAMPAAARAPGAMTTPRDIPVLATMAGETEGSFILDRSRPIDQVQRPPGVATAVDIYAFYMMGDSMAPRYEDGELIYVSGRRPVRPGNDVVVLTLTDGEHVEAACRRLIHRSGDVVRTTRFSPPGEQDFPVDRIVALHRILSMNDLFGV